MRSRTKDLYMYLKNEPVMALFETFVKGMLSYGCEVWGSHKANTIDKVFMKFCYDLSQ